MVRPAVPVANKKTHINSVAIVPGINLRISKYQYTGLHLAISHQMIEKGVSGPALVPG